MRFAVVLVATLLLCNTIGEAKNSKKGTNKKPRQRKGGGASAQQHSTVGLRIGELTEQLQAGELNAAEGVEALARLDNVATEPGDVATLNGVLGELYRQLARQQPPADRRRSEHVAVARLLRAAAAATGVARRLSALRLAADTAHDLSGGCAAELQFALGVQAKYAEAVGNPRSEDAQGTWLQLAQYQYFRQEFDGALSSLSRVEGGGGVLSSATRTTIASMRGSALKQLERYEEAVTSLREALSLLAPGEVEQTRQTSIHLGEALQRMGRRDEAGTLWEKGVSDGWFPSVHQRPGGVYPRTLPSRPVWNVHDPSHQAGPLVNIVDTLEAPKVWSAIRDESMAAITAGHFGIDPGSITRYNGGPWYHLVLYEYSLKDFANCRLVPRTCAAIEALNGVAQMSQGQVKLSLMAPGIHVLPHCGPTNTRVRMHLGLSIPPNLQFIVGGENASWAEGKVTVFDDSFEHEIIFPADGQCEADGESGEVPAAEELIGRGRLVLLFDTWHPALTSAEIQAVRHTLHTLCLSRLKTDKCSLACLLREGAAKQHTGACHREQSGVCTARGKLRHRPGVARQVRYSIRAG